REESRCPPAAEAVKHGHASATQDTDGPGLRPGLELDLLLALERGDRRAGSQRGVGHRQVDRRVDVVALAPEPVVRPDVDEHVDVARLTPDRAGVSLAGEPDALPVVDA